jgi:hypothetical protein
MLKREFLDDKAVVGFSNWLSQIISGSAELGFAHRQGRDSSLEDAKQRYRWPLKRIDIPSPVGELVLRRESSLAENTEVLQTIGSGLRDCLETAVSSKVLFEWVRATLIWGGVYTKRGNANWLTNTFERGVLFEYWTGVLDALQRATDDALLVDLRSNAGTTKVHSLVLPDWMIYDSRVAAALAWLVHRWSAGQPPQHLRFGCMRANSCKKKCRSPDQRIFPYFVASGHVRNHHKHAMWNLRANWILRAALDKAGEASGSHATSTFGTLREVEAALFMMGDDLGKAVLD